MPVEFNTSVIDEFRANNGHVGGPFENARLLLLTTAGARTGSAHTTPVGYLPDGDRVLVIASAAGAPTHPDWFHNLVTHPRVTVEDGTFRYQATATVLHGPERDQLFARAAEADPGWAQYQSKADRILPVVALEPIPGPPNPNAATFGAFLRSVHDAFRRELALVRREVAASGPRIGTQLRVNCLTVCQGLRHHHHIEDTGMFPTVTEEHPELDSVMSRLHREHESIAALLTELQQLLNNHQAEPVTVLAEVDRLIDELDTHLTYEEQHLIPALDRR